MRFHRSRLGLLVAVASVTLGAMVPPALAGVLSQTKSPMIRVLVVGGRRQVRTGIVVRHDFGAAGFTAVLSPATAARLEALGATVTPVPVYHVGKKPGGGGTTTTTMAPPATSQASLTWGVARVVNGSAASTATPSGFANAGQGVTVAVLDTGVDTTHPDLVQNLNLTSAAGCYNYVAGTQGCADDNGHGTFVAGIIAAADANPTGGIWGVAPAARLLTYKVCDSNGSCYADDVARAINDAVSNGANVINMSFGGTTGFYAEQTALQSAVNAGVLPVASAGNDSSTTSLCTSTQYPAHWPMVVSVAATDKTDTVPYFSCRGYNNGDWVRDNGEIDVAMPGVNVTSTTSTGGYGTGSGTSDSAAYMSGLAAYEWSAHGGASGLRGWLDSNADFDITQSIGGGATTGPDAASGFGLAYAH